MEGDKPKTRRFADYAIGYFHVDIAEVRTEEGKLYLFVAIDRTSKLAFAKLEMEANRYTASDFLRAGRGRAVPDPHGADRQRRPVLPCTTQPLRPDSPLQPAHVRPGLPGAWH